MTIRRRRWVGLAAVAASAAIGIGAATGTAHAGLLPSLTLGDNLVCEGHQSITFEHPVIESLEQDSFTSTGTLEDCYSPSGANPDIAKGTYSLTASGQFGCSGVETYTEQATYTWEDAGGNVLGTTSGTGSGSAKDDIAAGDVANFASGLASLTSSRFALQRVEGSFEPESAAGTCSTGVTSLSGTSNLDISIGLGIPPNLVCEGHEAMTFGSPVSVTPAADSFTVTGNLTDCESPSGSNPDIASGTVSVTGHGDLTCDGIEAYSESAVYIWRDAAGRVLGVTTGTGQGTAQNDDADGELANYARGTGDLTSSVFPLEQVAGSFEPRSESGSCATGIVGLQGVGQLSISAL